MWYFLGDGFAIFFETAHALPVGAHNSTEIGGEITTPLRGPDVFFKMAPMSLRFFITHRKGTTSPIFSFYLFQSRGCFPTSFFAHGEIGLPTPGTVVQDHRSIASEGFVVTLASKMTFRQAGTAALHG